jgi:hypothetical protein
MAGQHAGHRHREVVGELGGRDVDEQLRQVAALLLPARHLRDRLLENPPADLSGGAAVLGERDELIRRHHAQQWMAQRSSASAPASSPSPSR